MIKLSSIKLILISFAFVLLVTNSIIICKSEPLTQGVVDSGEEVELTYWLTIYDYYGEPGAEEVPGNVNADLTVTVNGGSTLAAFDAELIGIKLGETKRFIVYSNEHSYTGQLENQDLYYIVRINTITNDDSASATNTDTNTAVNPPQDWDELTIDDLFIPAGILGGIIVGGSFIYLFIIKRPQDFTNTKESTKISRAKQMAQLNDLQEIISKRDNVKSVSEKPDRKIKRR